MADPTNDFSRPARRFRRVETVLRSAVAATILLTAGQTLRDVNPLGVLDLSRVLSLPTVACAAVAVADPCADEAASGQTTAPSIEPANPIAIKTSSKANGQGGAAAAGTSEPRWSGDALSFPEDYRTWVLVGTSVGLGYSEAASDDDAFHHVYLAPRAYTQFRETGTFPEGTMLALEIREPAARVAPARHGSFSGRRLAVELAVKDTRRFAEGWAYFDFGDGRPTATAKSPGSCESCHRVHAKTDHVFTQFYAGLP